MSDDQFTKLFKYMEQEFKAVRREIAEVKGKGLHLDTQKHYLYNSRSIKKA